MRRRRKALLERCTKMDDAWRGWSKPLLKPSDTVALIESENRASFSSQGAESETRICPVHQFWIESEKRGCHVSSFQMAPSPMITMYNISAFRLIQKTTIRTAMFAYCISFLRPTSRGDLFRLRPIAATVF